MIWLRVLHAWTGTWHRLDRDRLHRGDFCRILFGITGVYMWWLKRVQRRAVMTDAGTIAPEFAAE